MLEYTKDNLFHITASGIDPSTVGLSPSSDLLLFFRDTLLKLLNLSEISPIQQAVQETFEVGWGVLLPTSQERRIMLSSLLPRSEQSRIEFSDAQQFLTELLVNSIIEDNNTIDLPKSYSPHQCIDIPISILPDDIFTFSIQLLVSTSPPSSSSSSASIPSSSHPSSSSSQTVTKSPSSASSTVAISSRLSSTSSSSNVAQPASTGQSYQKEDIKSVIKACDTENKCIFSILVNTTLNQIIIESENNEQTIIQFQSSFPFPSTSTLSTVPTSSTPSSLLDTMEAFYKLQPLTLPQTSPFLLTKPDKSKKQAGKEKAEEEEEEEEEGGEIGKKKEKGSEKMKKKQTERRRRRRREKECGMKGIYSFIITVIDENSIAVKVNEEEVKKIRLSKSVSEIDRILFKGEGKLITLSQFNKSLYKCSDQTTTMTTATSTEPPTGSSGGAISKEINHPDHLNLLLTLLQYIEYQTTKQLHAWNDGNIDRIDSLSKLSPSSSTGRGSGGGGGSGENKKTTSTSLLNYLNYLQKYLLRLFGTMDIKKEYEILIFQHSSRILGAPYDLIKLILNYGIKLIDHSCKIIDLTTSILVNFNRNHKVKRDTILNTLENHSRKERKSAEKQLENEKELYTEKVIEILHKYSVLNGLLPQFLLSLHVVNHFQEKIKYSSNIELSELFIEKLERLLDQLDELNHILPYQHSESTELFWNFKANQQNNEFNVENVAQASSSSIPASSSASPSPSSASPASLTNAQAQQQQRGVGSDSSKVEGGGDAAAAASSKDDKYNWIINVERLLGSLLSSWLFKRIKSSNERINLNKTKKSTNIQGIPTKSSPLKKHKKQDKIQESSKEEDTSNSVEESPVPSPSLSPASASVEIKEGKEEKAEVEEEMEVMEEGGAEEEDEEEEKERTEKNNKVLSEFYLDSIIPGTGKQSIENIIEIELLEDIVERNKYKELFIQLNHSTPVTDYSKIISSTFISEILEDDAEGVEIEIEGENKKEGEIGYEHPFISDEILNKLMKSIFVTLIKLNNFLPEFRSYLLENEKNQQEREGEREGEGQGIEFVNIPSKFKFIWEMTNNIIKSILFNSLTGHSCKSLILQEKYEKIEKIIEKIQGNCEFIYKSVSFNHPHFDQHFKFYFHSSSSGTGGGTSSFPSTSFATHQHEESEHEKQENEKEYLEKIKNKFNLLFSSRNSRNTAGRKKPVKNRKLNQIISKNDAKKPNKAKSKKKRESLEIESKAKEEKREEE